MTTRSGPWIATLAMACRAAGAAPTAVPPPAPAPVEGARAFDFELGTWRTHVRRLTRPLAGGGTWVEYDGTSIVRPVGGGRANLVELDVTGPAGRIEGVSLRLFDPAAAQWSLSYASLSAGQLTPPLHGAFTAGPAGPRGVFLGGDTLGGRWILVRFVIEAAGPDTIRFEQAFSPDGGLTWEVNWIATDTRDAG